MKKTFIKLTMATTMLLGVGTAVDFNNSIEAQAKTSTKKAVKKSAKKTPKKAVKKSTKKVPVQKYFKPTYKKVTKYKKKYPQTYKLMEKDILNQKATTYWKRSEFKKVKKENYSKELINVMFEIEANNPTKVTDGTNGISGVKKFSYYASSDVDISKIDMHYRLSKKTRDKYVKAVNSKVKSVAYKIAKPSDSDYKKVKAVHDYVTKTMTYDYRYLKDTEPDVSHLTYGGLILKHGVCDAYSKSVKDLLNYMGVEAGVIVGKGKGGDHAWNYVKIDGKYYYLDATWNDTAKTKRYFLINTKQMQKDHSWNKKAYPVATSTKYMKK